MAFFTGGPADYSGGRNQNLSDIKSTFLQSLGASFAEGAAETPVTRLAGAALRVGAGELGQPLEPDEANRRYGLPGLSFDKPITDALASDLWNDRKTQIMRDQAIASGPRNIFARFANWAGGTIPQFLDQVNAASVVVPGLGEEAVGAALVRGAMVANRIGATGAAEGLADAADVLGGASASLAGTRMGRAAKGAVSGIVGQAALEPLNYELDQSEHRDWSMNQALVNLAFGAVFGGAVGALSRGASAAERDVAEDMKRGAVNAENVTSDAHNERFDALTPDQRGSVLNESISAMVEDRPSVAPEVMDRLDPEGSQEAADIRAAHAPEVPLDHAVTVGHMPEGIEGIPSLPIRLEEGYHSDAKVPGQDRYGRIHIDARHGDQIRRRGYSSVQAYVEDTLANATTIRKGDGKSIFVARMSDELSRKSTHNSAVLHLMPDPDGYYRVATAGPLKRGMLDNMETLWDRESPTAEPLAPLSPPSEPGAPVETTPVSSDAPDGSRRDGFGGTNSSRASAVLTQDLAIRNTDRLTDAATRAVMDQLDPMRSVEDHGPFGPVFRQFSHDAQGAIAHLAEQQTGEALGALFHPEIGDIDLPWGKAGTGASDGYGLAKLVKFHPEVLSDLQGIIEGMTVATRSENRVRLETPDHLATVSLNYHGKKKSWLLTAYRKEEAENISRDARTDTAPLTSPDDTASRRTDIASESASMDTAPLSPPDDTASRRTDDEEGIAQDIARFQQEAQAQANSNLTDAATRAVMDEPADVTAARQAVSGITRNAPDLAGDSTRADTAEAERLASEAEAQLQALLGDEELTGEDRAISDVFEQAAEQLEGDAKAFQSAAACLWRNA